MKFPRNCDLPSFPSHFKNVLTLFPPNLCPSKGGFPLLRRFPSCDSEIREIPCRCGDDEGRWEGSKGDWRGERATSSLHHLSLLRFPPHPRPHCPPRPPPFPPSSLTFEFLNACRRGGIRRLLRCCAAVQFRWEAQGGDKGAMPCHAMLCTASTHHTNSKSSTKGPRPRALKGIKGRNTPYRTHALAFQLATAAFVPSIETETHRD